MSIEQRFDQLLIENIKYWKVNTYDVDGYNNDNEMCSYLKLEYKHDVKKPIFYINYNGIWSVLETEYSLEDKQIKEFTSSRLEQAYNFMDITTGYWL